MGAQESKNIEIAKNELKHPQTIIECHTIVFKVSLSDLGCHMSQSIFLDFRGFWVVFGGNMQYMSYMSTLQRLASSAKLGFWKNFGGPKSEKYEKISAGAIFFSPKNEMLQK